MKKREEDPIQTLLQCAKLEIEWENISLVSNGS